VQYPENQFGYFTWSDEMTRQRTKQVRRWTLGVSDQVARPKSPSLLAKIADECLGPFKYQTRFEAAASGHFYEELGVRLEISRELALDLIEDVAKQFNKEKFLSRGAPRFKTLINNITETQDLLIQLADKLDTLDDIMRCELAVDDDVNDLIPRLVALASRCETTKEELRTRRAQQNLPVVDLGGNTNIWKEEVGNPRWGLVNDALQIYEIFHPGGARGTVEGKFHEFVLGLFEYATGQEGADHAKVDDWIKRLVKAHREDKRLRSKQRDLDAECDEIACRSDALESDNEKISHNMASVKAIARKRIELWRVMYPHLIRNPSR
jgi:hypothetical protein